MVESSSRPTPEIRTTGQSDEASRILLRHLLLRARKFRLALMSLYTSAAILAGATLLGGTLALVSDHAVPVTQGLTCLAVVWIFVALIALLLDSRLAIEAIEHRGREDRPPASD